MLVLVCATFDVSIMSLSKYKEQYRGGGREGGGERALRPLKKSSTNRDKLNLLHTLAKSSILDNCLSSRCASVVLYLTNQLLFCLSEVLNERLKWVV